MLATQGPGWDSASEGLELGGLAGSNAVKGRTNRKNGGVGRAVCTSSAKRQEDFQAQDFSDFTVLSRTDARGAGLGAANVSANVKPLRYDDRYNGVASGHRTMSALCCLLDGTGLVAFHLGKWMTR
ncbi:hypothetical protein CERZMDRAFT_92853 [Cercospora zeae-maydis SCOH1-5]|uniref:Uncharacterized protein n=1 Tax=Cercospora zeae-maydis SCOH1-5 TaxID=717836 RepID=A0A6A6FU36_9PEZI|nr:hypothetical protein CERZMDRAFT_92853 [Cercospora zeae-maydis SCOH1-5]